MGRYLIVANQTLGGERLDDTVQERIERGDSQFFIVVPMIAPKHESGAWIHGGFPVGDDMTPETARRRLEGDARKREAALEEARRRADSRLGQMIERIRAAGGQAAGTVGNANPAIAVQDVLKEQSFDEIILSTLPRGLSRWLRMDLPRQIVRMTATPLTTIEAEPEP